MTSTTPQKEITLLEKQIENTKKWIEALRSGEYPQGKLALRTADNHYCCLGVACDILEGGKWKNPHNETHNYIGQDGESATALPDFEREIDLGVSNNLMNELVHMNDDDDASFKEIAEYIKSEHLYKLIDKKHNLENGIS